MINEDIDDENEDSEYQICDYFYSLLNENKININEENVNYLSPEELSNEEINTGKDIWNIGILLYKILSGKFPFEDKTMIETCNNIINVKYADLKIEFSELLNPLIHKLLLRESEERITIFKFGREINKINSKNYINEVIPFAEEEEEVKFIYEYKHKDISIIEDGKTITKTVDSILFPHCYLNVKMKKDIHHFIFQIHHGNDEISFGCSSNNKYNENHLCFDESSCSITLGDNNSLLCGGNGNITNTNSINYIYSKEGEEYELIFNMNNNSMSIKQGNGEEVLLFKNIKTPVYPFVSLYNIDDLVNLKIYWKE